MVRIFILFLISFCCASLSIYASCDLPTGGACKLEDLKKELDAYSKLLWEDKYLNQLDKSYSSPQLDIIKKDTPKRVDFEKLDNTMPDKNQSK